MIDSIEEYNVAKAIVQSESSANWDALRGGKGDWPKDKPDAWKKYQNFSISELKDEMKGYKQNAGKFHPAIHIPPCFPAVNNPPLISFLLFYCCFHLILASATGQAGEFS